MSYIRCEYRIDGYTLSDALRPDPKYGKKVFYTDRKHVPDMSDADIIESANHPEAVPKGYGLVTVHEGDRVILDRRMAHMKGKTLRTESDDE